MSDVIRVLIYIRVSTLKQAFEDSKRTGTRIADGSLEVQQKRAIEYIEQICSQLNKQYKVVGVLEDTKSAKDTDRYGYLALQEAVQLGEVDWIVTSEISRLHRDTLEFLSFKKYCKKYGVELLYIGAPYGQKDASTDFMETMIAALAEFERKQTSARLKKNINSRLKTNGKINGAEPILGLDKCPKRKGHFVINEREVKTLTQLLEIYVDASGEADAVRTAHMKGLRDKGGREFTKLRFKNILKNVEWRYAGKWYLQESPESDLISVQLDHGEVLHEELRKRVLIRINEQSQRNLKRGKHHYVYLLPKILKSSEGFSFSGQIGHGNTQDYRYYYCRELKQRINAEDLEKVIEKRVITYFKNSDLFKKLISSGFQQRDQRVEELRREISGFRVEIKDLEVQIQGLIKHMANPALSSSAIESIATKLNDFEAQKRGILALIQDKEQAIGHFLSLVEVTTAGDKIEKYASEFKNFNRIQKRELLENIFEKIEVMDPYLVKLHLKRPLLRGDSRSVGKKSCGLGRSGGTSRT
ncbi:MAG: recombinase family protein [Bacteriovoracaceae bacterium]